MIGYLLRNYNTNERGKTVKTKKKEHPHIARVLPFSFQFPYREGMRINYINGLLGPYFENLTVG